MEGKIKLLSVKIDLVFKLISGDQRNTDIFASFLKSVLDIPKEMSADERMRMMAEDREKACRDEASRLEGAERRGVNIGEERLAYRYPGPLHTANVFSSMRSE